MKAKRFYYLAEISNFIMVFLLAANVMEIWEMIIKFNFSPVLPIGILLILIFSYFLRISFGNIKSFMNNVFVFGAMHIIPLLLIIFVPLNVQYKLMFGLFLGFEFVCNLKSYFSSEGEGFVYIGVPFALIPALSYLAADIFHFKFSMQYFFTIGVVYIIMYYIRLFSENAYLLAVERKKNDKMPFEDMIKNDSKLAIPFVVISAVIMLVARIEALDKVSLFLYLKFAKFLGFLINSLFAFMDFIYEKLLKSDEQINLPNINMLPEEEEYIHSPLFNTISGIIFFAITVLVIVIIAKIIISIIKSISIRKEISTTTIEEEDMIEIREKIVKRKKANKEKLSKTRKQYKNTVEKCIKKGYQLKKYQTPKERAKDILKSTNEDINELSLAYEKERYGQFND